MDRQDGQDKEDGSQATTETGGASETQAPKADIHRSFRLGHNAGYPLTPQRPGEPISSRMQVEITHNRVNAGSN